MHDSFMDIAWDSIGQAMNHAPCNKRVFVSKHTVGICGVGKFMHCWKERDIPNCLRCGLFEDTEHVWLYKGANFT
jgi:hypothetical protein